MRRVPVGCVDIIEFLSLDRIQLRKGYTIEKDAINRIPLRFYTSQRYRRIKLMRRITVPICIVDNTGW